MGARLLMRVAAVALLRVAAAAPLPRAMLSVPKSRRHIMNISNLSSIHAGPLAGFLGKEWRWGNPDKPIPHKAVYYASRACLGGHHPVHWVPRVHK